MARSINDNPSFRAANSYRDFDMSQHLCFTSSVGQLLPVYYDVLNPGDKIRASVLMKSRTKPLKSPAFTKITEHCEWYFVPIQQLYKEFGSWFYGVQDYSTSLVGRNDSSPSVKMSVKFPYLSSSNVYSLFGSSESGLDNMMGENWRAASARLFDCLGVPSRVLIDQISQLSNMGDVQWSVSPLLFAAYQKIFMDYYRVDNRIANDPDCYNLDKFVFCPDSSMGDYYDVPRGMFELRYRPLRKDFFTNVFPSPIFGENQVGATPFGGTNNADSVVLRVNQWLTNVSRITTLDRDIFAPPFEDSTPMTVGLIPDGGTGALRRTDFNRANMETLYAADKLLEITRRAGKHYDAQTLAHFGVDVPNYIEGKAVRIGKYMEDFIIGDVVATSNTQSGDSGSPLGELAGKGYSAGKSKPVDFTAPCHGVLMCIYSAAPSIDYYQEGMDRLNAMIEREDWFTPEYDSLGMQPLFGYQCRLRNDNLAGNNELRGWQYRYSELKQKYNRIIAGFKGSTKFWTVGRDSSAVAGNGPFAYYHSPYSLDTIMEFNYLGGFPSSGTSDPETSNDVFDRDPLDHDFYFDVTKVSKMSRYGLMDFD